MKLVIDISEELYMEYVNLGTGKGTGILSQLIRAIKDGTPLPEGHGRLGDLDILVKHDVISESYANLFTIIEADRGEE